VLVVSLADDLEAVSTAWCAEHGVNESARSKIVSTLQTRLDTDMEFCVRWGQSYFRGP
jgi:hypothetical protein